MPDPMAAPAFTESPPGIFVMDGSFEEFGEALDDLLIRKLNARIFFRGFYFFAISVRRPA
jgi:hypothetical protein